MTSPDLIITGKACLEAFNAAVAADPDLWPQIVRLWAAITLDQWGAFLAHWLPAACQFEGAH